MPESATYQGLRGFLMSATDAAILPMAAHPLEDPSTDRFLGTPEVPVDGRRSRDKNVGVVRTGARANALMKAMVDAGFELTVEKPTPPRLESLSPSLAASIKGLYATLGGHDPVSHLRPGSWDLAFEGGLLVELDEQLHFNRYRAAALHEDWTVPLLWRDDYLRYCQDSETECLADGRWGKRWSNRSCEIMFGPADKPGVLGSSGSSRWKQRALYDAIKDAFALSTSGHRVTRLSIYDKIGGFELGVALDRGVALDSEALASFIEQRSASASS